MRIAILLVALLAADVAAADDKPVAQDPCDAFGWNMAREFDLMRASPIARAALAKQDHDAREVPLDRRLEVKLAPAGDVPLLVKPQREPAADTYSGLLMLKVPRIGTYRVSTDQRLWMEVIGPDGAVKSSKFANAPDCKVLHKSVAFRLQPDTEYWIQLSGSSVANAVVLITLDR